MRVDLCRFRAFAGLLREAGHGMAQVLRPHQASTNAHARLAWSSNTAISVRPLADALPDWEVLVSAFW